MKKSKKILFGIIAVCLMGSMAVILKSIVPAESEDSPYNSEEFCTDYFYDMLYKQDTDSEQCSFMGDAVITIDESSGYQDILSEMNDGILGAVVEDFNNDGICELLVSRVTSFKETYTSGKVISLQVYSPVSESNIVLMDEIELSRVSDTNMQLYANIVSVVTANNGDKYISVFTPYYIQGKSKKIAMLKINSDCKFEVSDLFIDPGYTSGLGLYYTNSISADKIKSVSYGSLDNVYEVNAPDSPDFNTYYQIINDNLSKYGISVKNATESSYITDFGLYSKNYYYVSNLLLERSYTDKYVAGVIDSYFPYKN